MKSSVSLRRGLLLLLTGLVLSGCLPSPQSQLDEEREPHFLAGKSRVNAMDYKGAIESFEKALEVNPQSASAHFELALLFSSERESDPAAAIYHYERYLKLQPSAGNAELVKQRILASKQELARMVSLGPVTEKQQRDIEKLTEENKRLGEENKQLRELVEKWQAYSAAHSQAQPGGLTTAPPGGPSGAAAGGTPVGGTVGAGAGGAQTAALTGTGSNGPVIVRAFGTPPGGTARTHTIKAGETLNTVARQHGVKLDALKAANPGVDPRRLRVGQTLNLPP